MKYLLLILLTLACSCGKTGTYWFSGGDTGANTDTDADTDSDGDVDTDADSDSDTNANIYIAAGGAHTCALLDSGDVKCWGDNGSGQLGDGTTVDKNTPVDVIGLSSGVQEISAGVEHTCVVLDSGGVMCWGHSGEGQLGDGTTLWVNTTPVDVSGLTFDVQAVTTGGWHTCALLTSGGMKCWGDNNTGQLGDGTTEDKTTPVDVIGLSSGVQAIAAGFYHTCALLTSGGVMCWGYNWFGQLGNGISGIDEYETTPVDVSGLSSGVQTIVAGRYSTCALLTSGGIKCWGSNGSGQLGNGIYGIDEHETTPVNVSGLSSGVQAIAAGYWHTCALLDSGDVKCWGDNGSGQLGNGISGDNEHETTPVDVSGLTSDVQAVAAGGRHTCAVLTSGGVMCWGYNEWGQLGNGISGDDEYETTPVDVVGF